MGPAYNGFMTESAWNTRKSPAAFPAQVRRHDR